MSTPPESDDDKAGSDKDEAEAEKPEASPKAPAKEKSPAEAKDEEPAEKLEAANETREEKPTLDDDTTSELSDVIDEPPKPKRKKKEAGAPKAPKEKKEKKAAAPENPDDAEIKKLQSHLVKCGIRKIWGFELKQYGDNSKAKIKHLRGMLKDIGMDGRFSEARAREIKERRELEADLEAVQEMNENWGAGGRSSRSKARGQPAKKVVEPELSSEEKEKDDEGDDDEEEEAVVSSRARGKARADLAFLGDDDEESD